MIPPPSTRFDNQERWNLVVLALLLLMGLLLWFAISADGHDVASPQDAGAMDDIEMEAFDAGPHVYDPRQDWWDRR